MTDDYAQRKVQVIREFLAAGYPAPYTVEAVVPRRDPLADTKFKIILNNQVERTLAVCAAVVPQPSHPGPTETAPGLAGHSGTGQSIDGFPDLP